MFSSMMDESFQRAKQSAGFKPSGDPFRDSLDEGFRDIDAACKDPYPGLQAEEQPVSH